MSNEIKKNEKGQILIEGIVAASPSGFYNGGWVKTVTGIDKTKTDGFSLVGEFVANASANGKNRDRSLWVRPNRDVFVSCGNEGSRKNARNKAYNKYHAFVFDENGKAVVLAESNGGSWAPKLWDAIEGVLSKPASKLSELRARRDALLAEVAKIDEELKNAV